MSDAKDIDDVASPELNVDTTKDDENEANIEPKDEEEKQDDTPEETADLEESKNLEDDSNEDKDEEPENEEEDDSDEVQDDEPEDTSDIEEDTDPVDDSDEDRDEEPENGEEKQDDNEAEEKSEEGQDDELEDSGDIEENTDPVDESDEDRDEEPENEEEKQDNNETEDESEEIQDDEPEDTSDIEEDRDEEPENGEEKQDDNEAEEKSEEGQDDEPEGTGDIEENTAPVDDSDEDKDEEPENEEEKQDDNKAEEESEEGQDDELEDTGGIEENADPVDDPAEASDEESEKEEDKTKLFNFLKWTGIVSLPLIVIALLLVLKPTVISNLFNTTELQIHTPKTAAIQWTAEELEMINVVGQTVTETEKIWNTIFTKKGGIFKKPDFTIFTGRIRSVCAEKQENELIVEQSSLGTFYCPDEKRIYIDLSLHRDLKNRLDIPGDFAQGYIVAHEIGHHVQNLAGISAQIPAARLRLSDKEFDMVSQRLELQADCFAGIWARHTAEAQYNVRPEEFADALNAVSNYSRKRLKQKKDNDIMPDPFTHGSPRLRLRWFTIGFDKGTFDACDTFTVMEL